jgi:hypothetical protein
MYRIRLANGEEAVYKSAGELALAVRMGIVSADAEVFHNTGHRWLPIAMHPDYRSAASGKRPSVPTPQAKLQASPAKPQAPPPPPDQPALVVDPPRPPTVAPAPAPAPVEGLVHEALDSVSKGFEAHVQPVEDPPAGRTSSTPLFRNRAGPGRRARQVAAAGIAVVGVVAAAVVAVWRTVLPRLERQLAAPYVSEGMPGPPPPEFTPRSYVDTAYPAPSAPLPLETGSDSGFPVGPTRTSRLRATLNRAPSYFEAYADARAEMEEGFEYIGFRRVFEPIRFMSQDSIRATRRMVSAAGNILRVYRGREVMLEQSYRPDDPGGKGTLREPFETAEATRALLADVDSLFGLLLSQQGRFAYDGETVRFQDRQAALAYADLRAGIAAAIRTWRHSASAPDLVTMPRLIRALGDFPTPPVR